jgi:hypothetical protein
VITFGIGTIFGNSQPIQYTVGIDNVTYVITTPEPSTALFGFGVVLCAATRRNRSAKVLAAA